MYEKENIVKLTIETTHEQSEILNLNLREQSEGPITQSHDHSFSRTRAEENCQEMINFLNSSTRNSRSPEVGSKLHNLGSVLCDELLSPQIKKDLQILDTDYLLLEISSDLVHIFWELLVLEDKFLCQKFRMGRWVKTKQKITKSNSRKTNIPMHMWLLADPKGNLPSAAKEGEEIFNRFYMQHIDNPIVEAQLDPIINKSQLIEKIRNYDIIHFAGHSDQNGWQLTSGCLSAEDIKKMAGGYPLPAIVFSNSCQSVGSTSWEIEQNSFDLAAAFMLAGARHYIGTFWDIVDEPSHLFALYFYEHLLSGKTIGDSIHYARNKLIEKGDDACWASYLLYGDPTVTYFEDAEEQKIADTQDSKKTNEDREEKPDPGIKDKEPETETISSLTHKEPTNKRTATKDRPSFLTSNLFRLISILMCSVVIYFLFQYIFFPKDTWTSNLTTLTVNFDDSFDFSKHDTIKHAINMALQDYGRFALVERGRFFEEIKKELAEWGDLPMDKRFRTTPKILPADVFVFFQVDNYDLLFTVCQTHTSRCPIYTIGNIHSGGILKQKERLAKNLIPELSQRYPIRGKIKAITENIYLNIGNQVGVKIGQSFKTVPHSLPLTIHTVTEDYSTCLLTPENTMVQIGWKVEHNNNPEKIVYEK